MPKKENKITKKALLAVLAIAFGTSQSGLAESSLNTKLFNLNEINSRNLLLAHEGGNCPGHSRQLIDQQQAYEAIDKKKKTKKKKKKQQVQDENSESENLYKYQVDREEEEPEKEPEEKE